MKKRRRRGKEQEMKEQIARKGVGGRRGRAADGGKEREEKEGEKRGG